ncbi:MAG: histidinol-phosphatase HisJ family protein [Lachnospiraceae bacterium]|nr:histidinol-phosphatase HisJ family protein [Lachnospiraceae bacterium]
MLADYHLHSSHSEDSQAPLEEQIEAGILAGLKYMCFTEHMDKDWPDAQTGEKTTDHRPFEVDTKAYYEHFLKCREKYKGRMELLFGIEYGFQPHLREHNEAYIKKYPFDFVIGSLHLLDGVDVYYPDIYEEIGEKEAYRRYFERVLESICLFDGYDVYGHIDYIVRYGPKKNEEFFYGDHAEVLEEILAQLIKRGKGIEINTAGFRKLGNAPNPGIDILKRYHDLGGEIITVGSDAHEPRYVAAEFERARKLLLELGYTHYCIFKERRPEFYDLMI